MIDCPATCEVGTITVGCQRPVIRAGRPHIAHVYKRRRNGYELAVTWNAVVIIDSPDPEPTVAPKPRQPPRCGRCMQVGHYRKTCRELR